MLKEKAKESFYSYTILRHHCHVKGDQSMQPNNVGPKYSREVSQSLKGVDFLGFMMLLVIFKTV